MEKEKTNDRDVVSSTIVRIKQTMNKVFFYFISSDHIQPNKAGMKDQSKNVVFFGC